MSDVLSRVFRHREDHSFSAFVKVEQDPNELPNMLEGASLADVKSVESAFQGGEIFERKELTLYGTKILAITGTNRDSRLIYRVVEPHLDRDMKELMEFILSHKSLLLMDTGGNEDPEKYLKKRVSSFITQHYGYVGPDLLSRLMYYVKKEFLGAGKLDVLFADQRIEDITVSADGEPVYVLLPGGGKGREGYHATDIILKGDDYQSLILRVGQIAGLTPSYLTPILDGTIKSNQYRVNTVFGTQVSPAGGAFTIRSVKERPYTIGDLIAERELNVEIAAWLWYILEKGGSGLIFGSTGSGKTTLLNAILNFVPYPKKVVVIEDTREIRLPRIMNWTAGTSRHPSTFDAAFSPIMLHDQLVAALRQRPDYIVVGEIRGEEAETLFDAMSTGHIGYGTVHAGGLEDMMNRFAPNQSGGGSMYVPLALMNSVNFVLHVSQVMLPEAGVFKKRRVLNIWENLPMEYRTTGKGAGTIAPYFVKDRDGNGLFSYNSSNDTFNGISQGILEGYLLNWYASREGKSYEQALIDLNRRAVVLNYITAERKRLNPIDVFLALNYYSKTKKLLDIWMPYSNDLPFDVGV